MKASKFWKGIVFLVVCVAALADSDHPEDDDMRSPQGDQPGRVAELHTCTKALKLPHVAYIEEDSSIFAQGIPWNLERIIQTKHETGKYTPPNNGAQVTVFLLDTSIQTNHREIKGKVMMTDFNSVPEEEGVRVHRQASQCDSHGTHIAGVLSGEDSGVARGVSVNTVRVLNCQGRGTVSAALAGLEYIRACLKVQPISPVILLLPFAGAFSRMLNTACREMVHSGAVVIAAAGNYQDDACERLLCRSIWSKRSGTESSDTAVSRCRHGEEMLSCSSYSPNGVHAGERIEIQDGQKVCEAHRGRGGQGVYAIARCCTGCSSHYIRSQDVSKSSWPLHSNRKACSAREGGKSHASCCHAPNLECHLIEHHQSELKEQVEVSCEDSWTLTGCNAVSNGSVTHTAYVRGNTCVIQMSEGDKAVTAFAICCRYWRLDQQQP